MKSLVQLALAVVILVLPSTTFAGVEYPGAESVSMDDAVVKALLGKADVLQTMHSLVSRHGGTLGQVNRWLDPSSSGSRKKYHYRFSYYYSGFDANSPVYDPTIAFFSVTVELEAGSTEPTSYTVSGIVGVDE